MENQMEKKMENDMETLGPFKGYIEIYRGMIPQEWRIKWKRTWNMKWKVYRGV